MNKEKTKSNTNDKIKERLELAGKDMDLLIEHFSFPGYNQAQCGVMKRVKANIDAVTMLLEEDATQ